MIKKLAVLVALTFSSSAMAQEGVLVQLCEGLNESVPSIVTAYELGKYPSEIKQLINPQLSEMLTNQGISLEDQSIVFTMSNGILDYTWLQHRNGFPAALIQNKISNEICSKFKDM
jgi:hypothetical protein